MTNEPFNPDPEEGHRPMAGDPVDPVDPVEEPDATIQPPLPPLLPVPPRPALPPRLVRDPYTRLGGVASGIAHYYGLDVSLVRIVFLLLGFASGFGFLAYLLAWLIIPRADYWPPAPRDNAFRSLGGRELGLALAGAGILLVIAIGAGGAGGVVIPLVLVGGGVWLLVQPANEPTAAAGGGGIAPPPASPAATAGPGSLARVGDGSAGGGFGAGGPVPPTPAAPAVHGAPVPPRRRRRGLIGVLVAVGLIVVAIPALAVLALVAAFSFGDVDLDFAGADTVTFEPTSAAALPYAIERDTADLTIDLTGLEADDFDGLDVRTIDARLDAGEITVIVPRDLEVSIDAATDVGAVDVYGEHDDGFGNRIIDDATDPDVELDLDIRFGAITVERG
ncbi:MAG: PspC domain-containing protein [Acidimicrobiales bacterium]